MYEYTGLLGYEAVYYGSCAQIILKKLLFLFYVIFVVSRYRQ